MVGRVAWDRRAAGAELGLREIWLRSGRDSGERRCDRCRAKENETVENPGAKSLVGLALSRAYTSLDAPSSLHAASAITLEERSFK
jgi:hypothetical protein